MSTQTEAPQDRDQLLARMIETRETTLALLDGLADEMLRGPHDAAGWTAVDHFYHLAAWRQIVLARLRGEPEYRAVGLADQASYLALCDSEDLRAINDYIRGRGRALGRDEVRAVFAEADDRLQAEVVGRGFAGLQTAARTATGTGTSQLDMIGGDTYAHDPEHRLYIQRIIEG